MSAFSLEDLSEDESFLTDTLRAVCCLDVIVDLNKNINRFYSI